MLNLFSLSFFNVIAFTVNWDRRGAWVNYWYVFSEANNFVNCAVRWKTDCVYHFMCCMSYVFCTSVLCSVSNWSLFTHTENKIQHAHIALEVCVCTCVCVFIFLKKETEKLKWAFRWWLVFLYWKSVYLRFQKAIWAYWSEKADLSSSIIQETSPAF